MHFSGGLVLRTHMRMSGSWHVYRPGEPWQRPRRLMRIIVETARFVAVAFGVHSAEFLDRRDLGRHRALRAPRTRSARRTTIDVEGVSRACGSVRRHRSAKWCWISA